MTQRITTCLWFDFNAEAAVERYLSIFADARVVTDARYGEAQPGPAGRVMTIEFEIEGQRFLALNGGPQFPFTPAISLIVNCETQAEIDHYWDALSDGGWSEVTEQTSPPSSRKFNLPSSVIFVRSIKRSQSQLTN